LVNDRPGEEEAEEEEGVKEGRKVVLQAF